MDVLRDKVVSLRGTRDARLMPWRHKRGLRRIIGPKRLSALLIMGALVVAGWYLRKHGLFDPATLRNAAAEYPLAAPILFTLLYSVAILTALPTLPLNLAAGVFWGPILGGVVSTTGATLGGVAAFAIARAAFGRPLADRFGSKLITEIQREFAAKGWWFVAFARLNPIFPTGPLNYVLGLTSITGRVYTAVTFIFLLPPSMAVAYMGEQMGILMVDGEIPSALKSMMAVSAAVTGLAVLIFATRLLMHRRFNQTKIPPTTEFSALDGD
jgi:uncharacterized membrane protein YdjX (TVP38/TMEM64 family)